MPDNFVEMLVFGAIIALFVLLGWRLYVLEKNVVSMDKQLALSLQAMQEMNKLITKNRFQIDVITEEVRDQKQMLELATLDCAKLDGVDEQNIRNN